MAALTLAPEQQWLEQGRALLLRGELPDALAVFTAAAARYPTSGEVLVGLAGLCWHMHQHTRAETLLRDWLREHPDDVAATFLLVQFLRDQGRLQAAAQVMRQLFEQGLHDVDTVIQAVEMLDGYGCAQDAAAICEAEIAAGSNDPRVHAYAGMLGIQLGEFARAREHYIYALSHSTEAVDWNIPIGLASLQHYRDSSHPDFALFRDILNSPRLSDESRTTTLFALGKAHDDIADYAQAANYLREANARAHAAGPWSRKQWKRSIEGRLAAKPYSFVLPAVTDWMPVFIVGVPRSGTTLLTELIARHPLVRNRGELGWLQTLAQQLSRVPRDRREPFEAAAARYEAQLRQDDSEARWFIDKQPLNLLYVDLIMALWPNARIIHCQRHARDTALSLWSQSFQDAAHDYAYDFDDIAAVIRGCRRLMAHWCERYPNAIRTVHYEEWVKAPEDAITELTGWLGLPPDKGTSPMPQGQGIRTASAWQARQPVHTRSNGRWRDYAGYLPDLLRIPEFG